jgi:hypothetical protein
VSGVRVREPGGGARERPGELTTAEQDSRHGVAAPAALGPPHPAGAVHCGEAHWLQQSESEQSAAAAAVQAVAALPTCPVPLEGARAGECSMRVISWPEWACAASRPGGAPRAAAATTQWRRMAAGRIERELMPEP